MKKILLCWCLIAIVAVRAIGQVVVVKGGAQKIGMDFSELRAPAGGLSATFKQVLQADLVRSGWFVQAPAGQGTLRLAGECSDSGPGLSAAVRVLRAPMGEQVFGRSYSATAADVRRAAHRAADDIVQALTGRRGMASARLVLVGNRTGNKELYWCDSDGWGLTQLTRDKSINLAPRWSPDGRFIFYTSYLKGYPDVYSIEVATGAREVVARYPGLNTGGAVSPDGRWIALILSRSGNPELYVKNRATGQLVQLTRTPSAEASPSWSPDGSRIVYVSDQPGTPQLYVISRDGGAPVRLTGRGQENVAPDWGPSGWIAFSSKIGGRYQLCIIHPDTREWRQLTSDAADYEDPSWAPDGRHIAVARTVGYRSSIYLIDTMGDPPVALLESGGDWFSPSWSP